MPTSETLAYGIDTTVEVGDTTATGGTVVDGSCCPKVWFCVAGAPTEWPVGAPPSGWTTGDGGPWATKAQAEKAGCVPGPTLLSGCGDCPDYLAPHTAYMNLVDKTGFATHFPNSIPMTWDGFDGPHGCVGWASARVSASGENGYGLRATVVLDLVLGEACGLRSYIGGDACTGQTEGQPYYTYIGSNRYVLNDVAGVAATNPSARTPCEAPWFPLDFGTYSVYEGTDYSTLPGTPGTLVGTFRIVVSA